MKRSSRYGSKGFGSWVPDVHSSCPLRAESRRSLVSSSSYSTRAVLMHLHGWTRSVLCISTLALSWKHGTSFLPGVVLRSGSAVFTSHRRSICPHRSCASGDSLRLSRIARLRGGGQSSTVYIADDSNESPDTRSISGVAVDGLSSTEEATTAGGAKKKRWLLGVSEHDG